MKARRPRSIGLTVCVLMLAIGGGLWYRYVRPLSRSDALAQVHAAIATSQAQQAPSSGIQVRVVSSHFGVDDAYAVGTVHVGGEPPLAPNQPFHVASIGMLFTSVTVIQLAEAGTLELADPIAQYLDADVLAGLFVVNGVDYGAEVTISQLLEHTSGIADYYADPVDSGLTVAHDIVANPQTRWTPAALLDVTRTRQHAVSMPGKQFHYSNTGYVLLGLLIESIEGKPFHQVLADRFFVPLGMVDTYMPFRSTPTNPQPLPMADVWLDGVNMRAAPSLTADWAGGGVVSTPDDLLRFAQALHSYKLMNKASYLRMITMRHQYQTGVYSGVGMMAVRFGEFSWMLDYLPESLGHMGFLATHLWYEPLTDTYVIMNYGSNTQLETSLTDFILIETTLRRISLPKP